MQQLLLALLFSTAIYSSHALPSPPSIALVPIQEQQRQQQQQLPTSDLDQDFGSFDSIIFDLDEADLNNDEDDGNTASTSSRQPNKPSPLINELANLDFYCDDGDRKCVERMNWNRFKQMWGKKKNVPVPEVIQQRSSVVDPIKTAKGFNIPDKKHQEAQKAIRELEQQDEEVSGASPRISTIQDANIDQNAMLRSSLDFGPLPARGPPRMILQSRIPFTLPMTIGSQDRPRSTIRSWSNSRAPHSQYFYFGFRESKPELRELHGLVPIIQATPSWIAPTRFVWHYLPDQVFDPRERNLVVFDSNMCLTTFKLPEEYAKDVPEEDRNLDIIVQDSCNVSIIYFIINFFLKLS